MNLSIEVLLFFQQFIFILILHLAQLVIAMTCYAQSVFVQKKM